MQEEKKHSNDREEKARRRLVLLIRILVLSLFWHFVILLTFNFDRAKSSYNYTQCLSNLKAIGTDLEIYKSDNEGQYPPTLAMLTPTYLENIPHCQGRDRTGKWDFLTKMFRKEGYEDTYRVSESFDMYTIYCKGEKHSDVGVGENYPQYNSINGLIAK